MACCCEPPPPPPPPPQTYGYYYLYQQGQASRCRFCRFGAPTAWQIEVSGFANGPASGSCASGTQCTGNNGTFILERIPDVYLSPCSWLSPAFDTTQYLNFNPLMPTCLDWPFGHWQLFIYEGVADDIIISLMLGSTTFGYSVRYFLSVPAEYFGTGDFLENQIDCNKTFTLDLDYSYGVGGGMASPCCCHGAPATIDIVPL